MPINNWKSIEDIDEDTLIEMEEDWDDIYDEDDFEEYEPKNKASMNTFINTAKIKKQKLTKEIAEELTFGSIKELMASVDGTEAYLGSYSESEFFAYRYQKVHGYTPDVFSISYIQPEKFVESIFKHCDIPHEAYYKSYSDQRGKIKLNSILFAFKVNETENVYLFMDSAEAFLFYNSELEKDKNSILYTLISLIKYIAEPKITKNRIFVVYQTQGGFEKKGFTVKKINVDLETNYNDGFPEVSDEIIKGLNDKNKTNLVILKGDPGTGKTSYIRHLTSKLKKNIIFIAPDMVNHITDPSFIPFLINNNDAVLIIEDAEPALGKRGTNGRTGAVSNILNLTDGLLSDCLNISIVATINTNDKDIDEALLRKGRLLKSYNFERLNTEKSKNLLKKLGREDIEVKEPMTLAEIYYYDSENNSNEYQRKRVGFGN
jgi:hypothetical protein